MRIEPGHVPKEMQTFRLALCSVFTLLSNSKSTYMSPLQTANCVLGSLCTCLKYPAIVLKTCISGCKHEQQSLIIIQNANTLFTERLNSK